MHDRDTGSRGKRADPVSAQEQERAEEEMSMAADSPTLAPSREGPGGLDGALDDAPTLTQFTIDHSPDPVFWIRADGRIAYVNEAACRSLGYDRDELLSLSIPDIAGDFPPSRWALHFETLRETGSISFRGSHKTKSGRVFPVDISSTFLEYQGEEYLCAHTRDVRESVQAKKALLMAEVGLDLSPDPAFWIRRDGTIHYVNEAACRALEYTRDELLAMTIPQIDPDYPAEAWPEHWKAMKEAGFSMFEAHHQSKSGRIYPVEVSTTYLEHEGEGYITAYARDVSERKQAEEALRKSEARWRTMVENLPIGAVLREGDTLMPNRAVERITGFERSEIDSVDTWFSAVYRDRAAEVRTYYETAREAGFEGSRVVTLWRKDGEPRQVQFSGYSDDSTEIWLLRDITEQEQAQADVERLSLAIEQTSEAVLITDPDGVIQYVNPAFERVTGYTKEEAVGRNPRFLKSGEHDREFYEELWRVVTGGETWAGRLVNRKKDGSRYMEDASISPVCSPSGEIVGYVGVKRDITDEVSLQDQLRQAQKMESIGRLAGGVAHDLNNLLSPILGYAELLLMESPGDGLNQNWLNQIKGAAIRGGELTKQLLAFSRKQILDIHTVSLSEVIAEFAPILQAAMGEDIELEIRSTTDSDRVDADTTQLDQILMNLAVNARDAMPNGGPLTIVIGATTVAEDSPEGLPGLAEGEYVTLTVADSGHGMDAETLDQAFDPFFTTKEQGKGTGLGLATVYGIVKQHEGYVSIASEVGEGTTVTAYFPAAKGAAKARRPRGSGKVPAGQGQTIVLAEDDDSVRGVVREILEKNGYSVLSFWDPIECVTEMERRGGSVDLLLTDVVMPRMNGRQLFERMAVKFPGLPVIYMSGFDQGIITERGVLGPGVELIRKPVSILSLLQKVHDKLAQADD